MPTMRKAREATWPVVSSLIRISLCPSLSFELLRQGSPHQDAVGIVGLQVAPLVNGPADKGHFGFGGRIDAHHGDAAVVAGIAGHRVHPHPLAPSAAGRQGIGQDALDSRRVVNTVVDGGIVRVAALVDLNMPGEGIDAVFDHARQGPAHEGPQEDHTPHADDHGRQDHRGPAGIAPDIAPGHHDIHHHIASVAPSSGCGV